MNYVNKKKQFQLMENDEKVGMEGGSEWGGEQKRLKVSNSAKASRLQKTQLE